MFGRSSAKQIDDQPGWREKLNDLRDSPPWVFERPEWMTESPAALLLMFTGTLLALLSVMYLVVPADSLPASLPGRWNPPPTSSTEPTTTTTTISAKKVQATKAAQVAALKKINALPAAQRQAALGWIHAVSEFRLSEVATEKFLESPPVPPSRRWTFAFLSAVFAVLALVAAWVVSDTRGRIHFGR